MSQRKRKVILELAEFANFYLERNGAIDVDDLAQLFYCMVPDDFELELEPVVVIKPSLLTQLREALGLEEGCPLKTILKVAIETVKPIGNPARMIVETAFKSVEATGGTFSIEYNGKATEPLPYDADSELINEALENIGLKRR